MNDRELLQQALDSLEWAERRYSHANLDLFNKPIEAIRTRLAQPEPEGYRWEEGRTPPSVTYTAPQKKEWVGLTDDERIEISWGTDTNLQYAIAIEAKLKEKNNDR
jgi:hypothetical protein